MSLLIDLFNRTPAKAMAFLQKKGYAISWNWFDTWKDAHSRAFTVAKVMKADILQDIRDIVTDAIDTGATFQEFKATLKPMLQKKGWWGKAEVVDEATGVVTKVQLGSVRRLQTIYQTNLQTAYMAGRYQNQAESGLPYLQYLSILDGQTTKNCRLMHLRAFKVSDPIWDHLYPPNHWGCRARVRSLTQAKATREGIPIESSDGDLTTKTVVVGKDEDAHEVEVTGIKLGKGNTYYPDPGWDYNPGKVGFTPDLNRYHDTIKTSLKDDL